MFKNKYAENNSSIWIASILITTIIFQICYGLHIIAPTNIKWLMDAMHDWGQHYLGFYFYRNEPWQFPIGNLDNYYAPIGSNVGFTDSIPILAIFFKIFSGILPEDFQYLGLWLFICHLLVAYFTAKICLLFNLNRIVTLFAIIILTANPVLVYRGLHPALCGHWLFLASIYLYHLNPASFPVKKILASQFLLLLLSGLINPYICFMVIGFTLIIPFRLWFYDKLLSLQKFILYIAISFIILLGSWLIVGLITIGGEDLSVSGAYGLYSLNLNAFYNATGFSSILPPFDQVSWHQYEGFMYLGVGMMIIIGFILFYLTFKKVINIKYKHTSQASYFLPHIQLKPLLFLSILLILFSITHIISLDDQILLQLPLPNFIIKLGEVFRASARFFWVPYYLIFIYIVVIFNRLTINNIAKYLILFFVLVIQFYDTKLLLTHRNLAAGTYVTPLDNSNWLKLMNSFKKVAFFPPFESHQLTQMDYQYFCFLAAKARKSINIGYVARADSKGMQIYNDSLTKDLENGRIFPDVLYVTTQKHLEQFSLLYQTGKVELSYLDGYYYLYSKMRKDHSLEMLREVNQVKNKDKIDSALALISNRHWYKKSDTQMDTANINYWIQRINSGDNFISIDGWAFLENTNNNKGDSTFIVLSNNDNIFIAKSKVINRPDITTHFNKSYLADAGFQSLSFHKDIPAGKYKLGIAIKNTNNQFFFEMTDRNINIGIPDFSILNRIESLPPEGKIINGFDFIKRSSNLIEISGWAAFEDQDATGVELKIVLRSGEEKYITGTERTERKDVTNHFRTFNFDHSGFTAKISDKGLKKGKYQIGLLLKDTINKKEKIKYTDQFIIY